MQSRAARAITKAVVAAGTAGAIATACWLLNRILDDSLGIKRIEEDPCCLDDQDTNSSGSDDEYDNERIGDGDGDSFALLPVVFEFDDESDAMDYTADYFTPRHDVCMLSVSVQTQVDPLQDVPAVDARDCRLCRAAAAATQSFDAANASLDLGDKLRALSFSDTDSSSGSVLSLSSEWGDHEEEYSTKQWLYVRL
jgi:hypothetical protein